MIPGSAEGLSTTAPAPSANSTQVPRSFQSTIRVSVSAPTTSAHFDSPSAHELVRDAQGVNEAGAGGLQTERRAAVDPQTVLQQACRRSGNTRSGVVVPTQIRSMSAALTLGRLHRAPRGVLRKIGRGLAFRRHVAAARCRCASGSTHRWYRPAAPDPRWSISSPADSCRCRRCVSTLRSFKPLRWSAQPLRDSRRYAVARLRCTATSMAR